MRYRKYRTITGEIVVGPYKYGICPEAVAPEGYFFIQNSGTWLLMKSTNPNDERIWFPEFNAEDEVISASFRQEIPEQQRKTVWSSQTHFADGRRKLIFKNTLSTSCP